MCTFQSVRVKPTLVKANLVEQIGLINYANKLDAFGYMQNLHKIRLDFIGVITCQKAHY